MCVTAKDTETRAHGSLIKQFPNVMIHADTCGPMKPKTLEGRSYFLTMTLAH